MRATGIGSLPGEDIDAALALVFIELEELPHLPELPGRGPGADLLGRTAARLVDLHVDLQPSGWRLVARAGLDERRAAELLERDLDALVPVAATHDGPLKVQLAGPFTLAAGLQLGLGTRAAADAGAVRDLVGSLAETVRQHVEEVRRRAPQAQLLLQLDEPSLPAVLVGGLPTASGLGRVRSIDAHVARDGLAAIVEAAGVPVVVHCCAEDVPFALLREAGVAAVSFDLARLGPDLDPLGSLVEADVGLWCGVVPALGPGVPPTTAEVAAPVRQLWSRLGFAAEQLRDAVTVTPACGLAGASDGWARTALRLTRQVARALDEAPERAR